MSDQQQARTDLLALNSVANDTTHLFKGNTEDINKVSLVHSSLTALDTSRANELNQQRDLLRGPSTVHHVATADHSAALAKQHEAQKAASVRPANAPTHAQHIAQVKQLDQQKFTVAKTIASLESELAGKEDNLASTKQEALKQNEEVISGSDVEGLDAEVYVCALAVRFHADCRCRLRLKLYRDLGFTPVSDDSGQFVKMLVST